MQKDLDTASKVIKYNNNNNNKIKGAETRKQSGFQEVREAIEDVVPDEVQTDGWNLNAEQVTKIINRKKNWSAPGPDRIANFWWKKATISHKEIATCFQATAQLEDLQFPSLFSEGKTALIPKPGEFRSDNQRLITGTAEGEGLVEPRPHHFFAPPPLTFCAKKKNY